MTADDWMSRSNLDDERDEARDARDRPLRQHWSHPLDCRCWDCMVDEYRASEGAS